jgi:adenylyltransferase/sulfurtransferase
LIYDAKDARFERVSIAWDPDNALSGRNPTILDLKIHAEAAAGAACGAPA